MKLWTPTAHDPAHLSDDAKRELRIFATQCILAFMPALSTWLVDALRAKFGPKKDPS